MTTMQNKLCQRLRQITVTSSAWDLSNQILYKMCQEHPFHKNNDEIIAKVLIIGRVYSAALERRKQVKNNSSMFYLHEVAPIMRKSKIDVWLGSLKSFEKPTYENSTQIIAVHKKVTDLFRQISGLEKDLWPPNIYIFIFLTCSLFMTLVLCEPLSK